MTQPTSGGAITAVTNCCTNCVEPSRPQRWGPDLHFFWTSRPCGPAGWLALLLTKAGDVETKPGPTTSNKLVWISDICYKQIQVRKHISIRCNRIEHYGHLRCEDIRKVQYTDTWICHLHRESRLTPHTDITPPHRSRPCSKPPTHSPPTPLQPKHRHMSNTSPVPAGLVTPKPDPLIHSPHSPFTPPRAKHIHISHTPPTPLVPRTTLIHNTSAALDTIPEPHVAPTCPALTTPTPNPSPTPAYPSPSHPLSAYTHATQTTVHASQSQQPLHPHRYHNNLTYRPRRPHDYRHNTRTQTQQ